jgi:hypothetical protein
MVIWVKPGVGNKPNRFMFYILTIILLKKSSFMTKTKTLLVLLLFVAAAIGCNDGTTKGDTAEVQDDTAQYSGPPYTIQLQEFVNPNLPDLHSYTHAVYGDKIVMIGGRTNGLHGNTYNFYQANSNKTVYVIDTKKWGDPTAWQVHSLPDTKISMPGVNTQQFRANNAQFFTNDSVLYVVGGMLNANVPTQLKDPKDPSKGVQLATNAKSTDGAAPSGPQTLALMTAINLPALINSVMNKTPMPANSIRQAHDTAFAVTGGELSVMNNTVYLVFGWNFYFTTPPTPQDLYSHQIRTFTYTDNGQTLTTSPVTVCATCQDRFANNQADSGIYRRRDGTMSAVIDPADGSQALMYYAGVFKNSDINHTSPVWIGSNTAAEDTNLIMRSNVYTCQAIPVYSASRKAYYASLLGGMRNATYNGGPITKPTRLTAANAPVTAVPGDFSTIPFTNQFSTVLVDAKHRFKQYLLPDSFPPTIVPVVLPANPADSIAANTLPAGSVTYNGTEAGLMWTLEPALMKANGVVDYDAFIKKNPGGGSVGYLHGGIQSALLNVFGKKAAHYSVASNRIFAVKIVPVKTK